VTAGQQQGVSTLQQSSKQQVTFLSSFLHCPARHWPAPPFAPPCCCRHQPLLLPVPSSLLLLLLLRLLTH
jgi:hypothetical protein